jgi:rare lipoprotein A (peptidoglycan hydrolase)
MKSKLRGVPRKRWIGLAMLLVPMILGAADFWDGNAALQRGDASFESGAYAASNSFPPDTKILIQNLETGKTTQATVTRRVGSQSDILVLLSPAAAKAVGISQGSMASVRVTVISTPETAGTTSSSEQLYSPDPDVNPGAAYGGPTGANEPVETAQATEPADHGTAPFPDEAVTAAPVEPAVENQQPAVENQQPAVENPQPAVEQPAAQSTAANSRKRRTRPSSRTRSRERRRKSSTFPRGKTRSSRTSSPRSRPSPRSPRRSPPSPRLPRSRPSPRSPRRSPPSPPCRRRARRRTPRWPRPPRPGRPGRRRFSAAGRPRPRAPPGRPPRRCQRRRPRRRRPLPRRLPGRP